MAEGRLIKINEEGFDSAISKLNEYKDIIIKAKENIIAVNKAMKNDWSGEGGTAFALSANTLERKLADRINDYSNEIQYIKDSKESILDVDRTSSKIISN